MVRNNLLPSIFSAGFVLLLLAIGCSRPAAEDNKPNKPNSDIVNSERSNPAKIDFSIADRSHRPPKLVESDLLESQLCTADQLQTSAYRHWVSEMKQKPRNHRKQWEFVYILKALDERGMLQPGKRGVGFGVGQEPLPAVMAKKGAEVLVTDLEQSQAAEAGWVQSGQYLDSLAVLNSDGICEKDIFNKNVHYQDVDMNAIPPSIQGYDFTWSSCALEHTGSLETGMKFIENSIETLKPGGIAVHTTEFNLSSNEHTIETGGSVIYRKKDIEQLVSRLRKKGYPIEVNFYFDDKNPLDRVIDFPPFLQDNHLRLLLENYVSTSIGLIIKKP